MRVADGSTRPVSSPTPPRPRTDLRPTGPRRHLRSAWGPPCTRTPSLALTFARLQLLAHPHHTHTVTNDPSSQARPAGVCTPTRPCAPPSLRGARSGSLFAPCTQPGPPPLRPTRGWAPAVPPAARRSWAPSAPLAQPRAPEVPLSPVGPTLPGRPGAPLSPFCPASPAEGVTGTQDLSEHRPVCRAGGSRGSPPPRCCGMRPSANCSRWGRNRAQTAAQAQKRKTPESMCHAPGSTNAF